MLYNLQDNILKIKNLFNDKTYEFDLSIFDFPGKFFICYIVYSADNNKVILSFKVQDVNEKGLVIKTYNEGLLECRLRTRKMNIICDKACDDFIFDKNDSNKLFVNISGCIYSFNITNKSLDKIYKFRNCCETPIYMKQNENGKLLLFSKSMSKTDKRKLHIINLENNTLNNTIGNTSVYDFINNSKIVCTLSKGLKTYNIISGKTNIALKNTSELIKKCNENSYAEQIYQILDIAKLISDEISEPFVFNKRIYFKVFILGKPNGVWKLKNNKFQKWCSFDKYFNDFQIHFEASGHLSKLYAYKNNSKIIFVENDGMIDNCNVYDSNESYVIEKYEPIISSF